MYLVSVVSQHLREHPTCLILGYLDNGVSFVGLWCISMSSLDRLVAVSQPIMYRRTVKHRAVLLCFVCVCVLSLVVSSLIFLSGHELNTCISRDPDPASRGQDHRSVYLVIYQVLHTVVPLSVSLTAYIGIFLSARSLRQREIARKKVIREVNRRVNSRDKHQIRGVVEEVDSRMSAESGIGLDEEEKDDEHVVLRHAPGANPVPEQRRSIKFSNTTVFVESLNNTFFSSNIMEELNKQHEDYFSLSVVETEPTDSISTVERAPSFDKVIEYTSQISAHEPVVRKKGRSLTEKLQIKTGILLISVVVVIVGSHVPTIWAELSPTTFPENLEYTLTLQLIVYCVNPLLFGFLNNTLRTKLMEIVVKTLQRRRSLSSSVQVDSSILPSRKDSVAAFKRFGKKISAVGILKKQKLVPSDKDSFLKASDMSILSQKSVIRDQMTLRYFETNL